MRLNDYLVESESVKSSLDARNESEITGTKQGELACTSARVVFVDGKNAIDISITAVNSIEYKESEPHGGLIILFIVLTIASASAIILGTAADIPFGIIVGIVLAVVAVASFAFAFVLKRSRLDIHTPNETYKFSSKGDLQTIAHAIRGHE